MFLGLTTYDRVQRPKEPSTVRRDPSVGPKPVHCLYNTDKSGKSTTPSKRVKTPVKSWLKNQPIDEEDCGLKVNYDMWDTSPIEARTIRHQAKQLEMSNDRVASLRRPAKLVQHRFDQMADSLGKYSSTMVHEVYASYAGTVTKDLPQKDKELLFPPYLATLVWDILFNLSKHMYDDSSIDQLLSRLPPRLNSMIRLRQYVIKCNKGCTEKSRPVEMDWAVIVACLMAEYEIDFNCLLIAEIHERGVYHTMIDVVEPLIKMTRRMDVD
ncbi:hypothetical protein KY284_012306 [Solanum tuberosum]|nr:hypothetical protein KY284_012306 [Solanum tuberosum]